MKYAIACAVVLAAGAASAEDARSSTSAKLGHNSFGLAPGMTAPPDLPPLTTDQLRACFVDKQKSQVVPAADANSSKQALLDRQTALKARQAALGSAPKPTDPRETVLAYNAKVQALQADFDALHRDADARNGQVGGANAAVDKFNKDCAGRTFSTPDLTAVQKAFPDVKF